MKKTWDLEKSEETNYADNKKRVTVADIKSLKSSKWLNDQVINSYFDLIFERAKANEGKYPSVFRFSTFFYNQFLTGGYKSVERWGKNIFKYDLVLIPVNPGQHWTLVVVNMKERTVQLYDSLQGNRFVIYIFYSIKLFLDVKFFFYMS